MSITAKVAVLASILLMANAAQGYEVLVGAKSAMEVISTEVISKSGNAECDLIFLPGDKGQDGQMRYSHIGKGELQVAQVCQKSFYKTPIPRSNNA